MKRSNDTDTSETSSWRESAEDVGALLGDLTDATEKGCGSDCLDGG